MSRPLTTRRVLAALGAATLCAAAIAVPTAASANGRDHAPAVTLFPSNTLTVRDPLQLTGRRVALPLPDCATAPTDCNTVKQLNQLDGFDIDPRISLTFGGERRSGRDRRRHDADAGRRAACDPDRGESGGL